MAWKLLLTQVPWADVIRNAPAIIDSARKLWGQKDKKGFTVKPPPETAPEEQQLAVMQQQIAELSIQLQAASGVIQSLAEQNGLMIARVEKTRRRLLILAIFNSILALAIVYLLFR